MSKEGLGLIGVGIIGDSHTSFAKNVPVKRQNRSIFMYMWVKEGVEEVKDQTTISTVQEPHMQGGSGGREGGKEGVGRGGGGSNYRLYSTGVTHTGRRWMKGGWEGGSGEGVEDQTTVSTVQESHIQGGSG